MGGVTALEPDCSSVAEVRYQVIIIYEYVLAGGTVVTEATAAVGTREVKVVKPVCTKSRTTCEDESALV